LTNRILSTKILLV